MRSSGGLGNTHKVRLGRFGDQRVRRFTRPALRRFPGFGLKRPPDGADPAAVFLRKLGNRSTLAITVGNDPLLAIVQPLGPPKLLALAPSPLNAGIGAAANEAALELSNTAHDGQHEPANVGRRIAPAFPKAYEA